MKFSNWIKNDDQSWASFFLELALLLALVLFIRTYVFQFFRVSGPSMCPTLNSFEGECYHGDGEFIFVNEFIYSFLDEPKHGEIVVFTPPTTDKNYIKRIIGTPGDIVEVVEGKVYLTTPTIERTELPEDYLSDKNRGRTYSAFEKFEVPEGQYLLFGDNRLESLDARRCFEFDCTEDNSPFVYSKVIRGRAEFAIWPINKIRWMIHELFLGKSID